MRLLVIALVIAMLFLGCTSQQTTQQPTNGSMMGPKNNSIPTPTNGSGMMGKTVEVQMSVKQWEFSPNTITVKKGDRVKLVITTQDVAHGFSLPTFNINAQINPGQPTIVEFTADQVGEFDFRCSVFCGAGHSGLSGKLIVEQ